MADSAVRKDARGLADADMLSRIAAGDMAAFELLMRRYNRPLYRTARSIVRDDADAEDVLQEAYLLIFRNLGKFRGEASLSTWLTRIVVNEAIARSRKNGRTAEIIRFGSEPETDIQAKRRMQSAIAAFHCQQGDLHEIDRHSHVGRRVFARRLRGIPAIGSADGRPDRRHRRRRKSALK